jgi:glucose/mannose transport system permease protein
MSAAATSVSPGSARFARYFIYATLVIFALIYLLPLFVMIITSLKPLDEIRSGNMLALPQAPSLDAWFKAWGTACVGVNCTGISGYFWNSIKMVIPAVAISTILGALNGYVLTAFPATSLSSA